MMKLSRKGLNKVHCSYVRECSPDLDQLEFEPSDFEGVVVLTVEQAKRIISLIKESFELMNCDLSDGSTSLDLLYEGIKQAEGKE